MFSLFPHLLVLTGVSCETNVSERFCEICRLIRAGIEASKNPVQLNHLRSTTILHLSDLSKRGFEAPFECPATCSPAFTTFSSISAVEAPASGEEHLQNKSTTGPLPKGKLNVIEPQAFELRSTINWPVVGEQFSLHQSTVSRQKTHTTTGVGGGGAFAPKNFRFGENPSKIT